MFLFRALPTLVHGRANEPLSDAKGKPVFHPQPTLMTARTMHFKGVYDGDEGAKTFYLRARPNEQAIDDFKLPADIGKDLRPQDITRIEAAQVLLLRRAKQAASFWLGLVHFEQKNYPEAADFFAKRSLEPNPKGPWSAAARYNLARTYEAMGETDKAIAEYEADKTSPQSHGNQLRARWLRERGATAAK
jgi:tetratricopeptide (TPR) repeat protein